ncbi:MAG: MYXO-CTERM sorting domain-containing protein [Pseudomonadota bacterium]
MKSLARLLAASTALLALQASAMEVSIDLFGTATGAFPSVTFEENGQAVDITGEGAVQPSDVFVTNFGVGVAAGDTTAIDAGESLTLDFSPAPVNFLSSITLDIFGPEVAGPDFALLADGISVGTFDAGPGVSVIDFGGISGSTFTFISLAGDAFYLRSVTVDAVTVAAPGTLALLLLGAVSGLVARRRSA